MYAELEVPLCVDANWKWDVRCIKSHYMLPDYFPFCFPIGKFKTNRRQFSLFPVLVLYKIQKLLAVCKWKGVS